VRFKNRSVFGSPLEEFNPLVSLHFPEVLGPLALAIVIGAAAGWLGERMLPTRS